MRNYHTNKCADYCPIINLDMLWTLVPQATRDQLTKDKAPVIDCVRAVSKWNVLLVWAYITKSSDVTLRLLSRLRNYSGPVVLFYGICICVIIDHHEGRCYVTHSQIMINVKKTHFLQSLNSRAPWTSGSTQSWQRLSVFKILLSLRGLWRVR